ncbi:CIC11C00000004428 [Sungouiella intermedia]|uniref:CIC11C00000004428 n=1 Tax=Sungouiella intermedia TaxID=45354 RepID=A0A1L0C021_9ASCO|nr:CIC11C00000005957 [[Candida] intermedia]SGZ56026.1 CIC11C00000004428 [[Candida] intermedia]
MPDLFDNFFGKISQSITGKSPTHYGMNNQVNSGRFYSYHENGTNNKSWMTLAEIKESFAEADNMQQVKPRMGSVSSMDSEPKSRNSSISE